MRLYIKNMVCQRCILAVRQILETVALRPLQIALGEVDLAERPTDEQFIQLKQQLTALGFEMIDDRKSRIIEQIKTLLLTNWITLIVMGISIIGVLKSVLNKRKIRCACLGAVFNLPMSTVTIVEDAVMILMSGFTLYMTINL